MHKENVVHIHTHTHTHTHTYIHTMEDYSAIKKEIQSHATMWMKSEDIMLAQ